jgi:uncharacterized protein YegL
MYAKNISTDSPTLVLFLIDQSGSMAGAWGSTGISKKELAANALNQTLYDLTPRGCMKDDEVVDRIHVGIIGYGQGVNQHLGGSTGWLPATEWCTAYSTVRKVPVAQDGGRILEQDVPIWVEPASANGTPMPQALELAASITSRHTSQYADSHPPIIINITDGQAGGIEEPARKIRTCSTEDGDALLFTIQIASDGGRPIIFPATLPAGCSSYTETLFEISSVVPALMAARARSMGINIPECGRGIALDADPLALTQLLQVGTTLTVSPVEAENSPNQLTESHDAMQTEIRA